MSGPQEEHDQKATERRIMALWMRAEGAPEEFIRHFEETGEIRGDLWPLRWPLEYYDQPFEEGRKMGGYLRQWLEAWLARRRREKFVREVKRSIRRLLRHPYMTGLAKKAKEAARR